MNKITVNGTLKKDGRRPCAKGYFYRLDAARRSGTVDSLLLIDEDGNLPEGHVEVTGRLESSYIHGMGVPAYIVPESIRAAGPGPENGTHTAEATGRLRDKPICRKTAGRGNAGPRTISTVLVDTEDGTIPVLLWNNVAESAAGTFQKGDMVHVSGRMQSRDYPTRDGKWHTTYELSANRIEPAG